MLTKIGIILQFRLFLDEPPGSLVALRPVFPENAAGNLTCLDNFRQPFLHRDPDLSTFAMRSVAMNHLEDGLLLLARRRDLTV